MKNFSILILLLIFSLCIIGCKSSSLIEPPAFLRLQEQPYSLTGDTVGEGKATRILFFGPVMWNSGFLSGAPMMPFVTLSEVAKEKAMFDALSKLKDADMVTLPRFEIQDNDFLLMRTVTVKVTCKGVKLKNK